MPTYQYSCTSCGHFFEQFQSFSDDSLTVCPECHGRLRKVFNAVGVVFKGSGFYRNDSRGQKPGSENGASGNEDGGGKGGRKNVETGGKEADSGTKKPSETTTSGATDSKKSSGATSSAPA